MSISKANNNSITVSLLCAMFIVFYFNSCLSGYIKGSAFSTVLLLAIWSVLFILTSNSKILNDYFFLVWPLMLCIVLLLILSVFNTGESDNTLKSKLFNLIYLVLVMYLYVVYCKPGREFECKAIFIFWSIDTIVSCLYTIYRLEENEQLARLLSTGDSSRDRYLSGVDTRGIVSYGMIYGLLFILLFLLRNFFDFKQKRKWLPALFSIIIVVTIVKSQFSIALLVMFFVVIYALFFRNSKNKVFEITFLLLLFFIFLFSEVILEWLISLDIFGYETTIRLEEILLFLRGEDIRGTDLLSRMELYSLSGETILDSWFMGCYIINTETLPGNHSEILDTAAYFGIGFLFLVVTFFVNIYKNLKSKISQKEIQLYTICYLIMLFISVVNTSLWMPMPMILLLILPIYTMGYKKDYRKGDNSDEYSAN